MFKYKYVLAGYTFEIDSLYDYFYQYAKEYETDKEVNYSIVNTNEELDEWILSHHETGKREYLETLLIQTKIAHVLINHNVYIFHGSSLYINNKDNGYIFTGPSGVGKSTYVRLLKEVYKDQLTIINDDKPFISSSYTLYGSPWSGKSHISNNIESHLRGIFILFQDKSESIKKLEAKEAINHLIKQIYIPKGSQNAFVRGAAYYGGEHHGE